MKIPPNDTTYWNRVIKLDDAKQRRHIVQIEPIIESPQFVHHMLAFHCETTADVELPLFSGNAKDAPGALSVCTKTIAFWVSEKFRKLLFVLTTLISLGHGRRNVGESKRFTVCVNVNQLNSSSSQFHARLIQTTSDFHSAGLTTARTSSWRFITTILI